MSLRAGKLLSTTQKEMEVFGGSFYQLGIGSGYEIDGVNLFINSEYGSRDLEVDDAKQRSKSLGITVGGEWSF